MLDSLRHTFKHSFIYSIGNLSAKIVGLVLLPLYTAHLTTSQYGILSIIETTSMFLVSIFSLNLSNALMRWWVDAKDNREKGSINFTGFSFLLFVVVLMNLMLQPFSGRFANLFFNSSDFTIYFNILFVSAALDILTKYFNSLLRILEKSFLYIILNTLKLVVLFSLNIYFIVVLRQGVKGIILAQLITNFFLLILYLLFLIKYFYVRFKLGLLKEMLVFSIPLTFASLSAIIFTMSDRYVLKFKLNDAAVGIYTLSYKIAGFLNFFILQSFQLAFTPIVFKNYKKENSSRFFGKTATYLTMILVWGALLLAFFSKAVIMIFGHNNPNYMQASDYVALITVSVILQGFRYFLGLPFSVSKKTLTFALFVIIFATFNIGLNILLIPYFQIKGVIYSSIFSLLLMDILFYFVGRKYYFIDFEIISILKILFIGIVLYLLSIIHLPLSFWYKEFYKLALLLVFPFIIYFSGILEPIEKQRLAEFWQKWKNPRYWKTNLKK